MYLTAEPGQGFGLVLRNVEERAVIRAVAETASAAARRLRPNDIIVSAANMDARAFSFDHLVEKIKAMLDSVLVLRIARPRRAAATAKPSAGHQAPKRTLPRPPPPLAPSPHQQLAPPPRALTQTPPITPPQPPPPPQPHSHPRPPAKRPRIRVTPRHPPPPARAPLPTVREEEDHDVRGEAGKDARERQTPSAPEASAPTPAAQPQQRRHLVKCPSPLFCACSQFVYSTMLVGCARL